jgi:hypothetical protein
MRELGRWDSSECEDDCDGDRLTWNGEAGAIRVERRGFEAVLVAISKFGAGTSRRLWCSKT